MLPPDFAPTRIGLSLQGELYKNCRFLELSTAYRLRVSVTNLSWTRWKAGSVMKYCPVRVLQYISLKTELFLVAPYIFSSGLIYKCTYFCFVSFSSFAQYRQKCNAKLVAGFGNHVSCNQALFKFFPSESRQKEKFPRLSLQKKKTDRSLEISSECEYELHIEKLFYFIVVAMGVAIEEFSPSTELPI